jgi:hypothetical protein
MKILKIIKNFSATTIYSKKSFNDTLKTRTDRESLKEDL